MQEKKDILIADGGSTKVEWCRVSAKGEIRSSFETRGINTVIASAEDAASYFHDVAADIGQKAEIGRIFYYGSGCSTPEICRRIADVIDSVWHPDFVEVAGDTLGACRALLGRSTGVGCILGTGSNSALYDGNKIVSNVASLGYILDDEGSGSALGKRLLSDIFKGLAPRSIIDEFLSETGLSKGDVLRSIYASKMPNQFLASFSPYINRRLSQEYFHDMAADTFRRFFERNLLQYPGIESLPVCFTGSIAAHFAPLLKEIGKEMGLNIERIDARPMPGLMTYHLKTNCQRI